MVTAANLAFCRLGLRQESITVHRAIISLKNTVTVHGRIEQDDKSFLQTVKSCLSLDKLWRVHSHLAFLVLAIINRGLFFYK